MRILAIDPGMKCIGLAISDPSGSVATPLVKISHQTYKDDAESILEIAEKNQVDQILIGQSLDENGKPTFAGRLSLRLANALRCTSKIPILFWDEAFTTQDARAARVLMNTSRERRSGHLDSIAAVVLLQSYLDRIE